MGGRLREGIGPSSSASREEVAEDEEDDEDSEEDARAQVTDGEPPAPPCRITSLVGRCRGGWLGAPEAEGGGGPWLGSRCPSEEAVTGRPREREEDTYSSVDPGDRKNPPGLGNAQGACAEQSYAERLCTEHLPSVRPWTKPLTP